MICLECGKVIVTPEDEPPFVAKCDECRVLFRTTRVCGPCGSLGARHDHVPEAEER
jgi:hypothetical protein